MRIAGYIFTSLGIAVTMGGISCLGSTGEVALNEIVGRAIFMTGISLILCGIAWPTWPQFSNSQDKEPDE